MPGSDQTTLLWNNQTQLPESVPLDQAQARVAAGTHSLYGGSNVEQDVAPGVTAKFEPGEAGFREQALGAQQALTEVAKRSQQAADDQQTASYATTSDAIDAFGRSYVKSITLGIDDPTDTNDEARAQVAAHPWAAKAGDIAAIAVTLLPTGGESAVARGAVEIGHEAIGLGELAGKAIKATPLGAAVKVQEAATQAIRNARIAAGGKGTVLRAGLEEAVGGAVGGAVMATGQQVGNALHGKPVSGDAVIDDIGLGAVLGGTLGVVGGAFGKQAQRIGNAKEEILSAAEIDKVIPEAASSYHEATANWKSAHIEAAGRLQKLDAMNEQGLLDAEQTGDEWLADRHDAAHEASKAEKAVLRAAGGVKNIESASKRMEALLSMGKPKELERLAGAFGDYQQAVEHFDTMMRPTDMDAQHLLDLNALDDLDTTMSAHEHTFSVLGDMVEKGVDDATLNKWAREQGLDEPIATLKAEAERVTGNLRKGKRALPEVGGKFDLSEVGADAGGNDLQFQLQASKRAGRPAGAGSMDALPGEEPGLPGMERTPERPTFNQREPTRNLREQPIEPTAEPTVETKPPTEPTGGPTKQGRTAFEAHSVLNGGRYSNLTPQSALATKVDEITRRLIDNAGGRLGTEEARLLAEKLGVNAQRIADAGPLAQSMVDVWSLRKMAEAAADETSGIGKAMRSKKPGMLTSAIRSGVISKGRQQARALGGPFAAGVAGSLLARATGTMVGAAGVIAATAGRFRNAAVQGIATALSPMGRRAITTAVLSPAKTSYDGSEPTTDFRKKAEQLHQLSQASDAVNKRIEDQLSEMRLVDNVAAMSAAESAQRRLKNLTAMVPTGTYRGPLMPPGPPDPVAVGDFHTYEALTFDKSLVFQFIKSGSMPQAVVSAMREQHPDFLMEISQWVAEHPDEVAKAPHNTQLALSSLLGMHLVPEADPLYIARQQEAYQRAKQKAQQTQANQQGASALRGGMPAPLPVTMTPAQQFSTLPTIR